MNLTLSARYVATLWLGKPPKGVRYVAPRAKDSSLWIRWKRDTRPRRGYEVEGLWIIIGLLLAVWLVRSVYNAYKERVEGKLWEAHVAETRQLVTPIAQKSYDRLTREIRNRCPLVPFKFPTLDHLLLNMGTDLRYYGAHHYNLETMAKKVLAPVVSKAVADFISYSPNLTVSKRIVRNQVPQRFSADDDRFRTTEYGRNPPDWAERRKAVYNRDRGCCRRCGVTVSLYKCHIHHLVRRSAGGHHSLENLVTLCIDCHGLMPKHEKVTGGPFYHLRGRDTLHTQECHYAFGAIRIEGSLPSLVARGFTPCQKCMPRAERRVSSLWIERFARARLSSIVKSSVVEYGRNHSEQPGQPSVS